MYGKSNSIIASTAQSLNIADYMLDSLNTWEQTSIWSKLLYKEDIKAVDPVTGAAYEKTIKFTRPQGAGGVGSFSKSQWQNAEQPGNIGMMIPTGEQITIGTSFKYTTIGRTFQDSLADNTNLYEAIKQAEMGDNITKALEEMVKAKIYQAATKTYAGAVDQDAFEAIEDASTATLTWEDVKAMVIEKETYIVQLRNNHERANTDFQEAVRTITTSGTGGTTAGSTNLVDMEKWHAAQEAFSKAWRTERLATPRYIISGIDAKDQYVSSFVSVDQINIAKPELKTLYSKAHKNQTSPMLVLTGNAGYNQLFEDENFLKVLQVSGFQHEAGMSGRHQRFIPSEQAINVQGILIVNMQQDELKYGGAGSNAVLGGGVSFGDSVTAKGFVASTAFTAVPGFNFITRATEGIGKNGIRVTSKKFDDIDMMDRFGFHEFTNMLFAWDVVIMSPESFSAHIFLEG